MNTSEKNKKLERRVIQFIISAACFFLINTVCLFIFSKLNMTEIRPDSAIPPALGIIFGLPGAIGCSFGTLVSDLLHKIELRVILCNFVLRFLYSYIPYLMWKFLRRHNLNKRLKIDNVKKIIEFEGVICFASLYMAFFQRFIIDNNFHFENLNSINFLIYFLNNLVSAIFIGMPLVIGASIQQQKDYYKNKDCQNKVLFSLNEKMVLSGLSTQLLIAAIVCFISFNGYKHYYTEELELWNCVFLHIATVCTIIHIPFMCSLIYYEKHTTIPIERIANIAKNYASETDDILNSRYVIKECKDFISDLTEVGDISRAFVYLAQDLEVYIADLKKLNLKYDRLGAEISLASSIRESRLPQFVTTLPENNNYSVHTLYDPSKIAFNNFYDTISIDDHTLAVVIGKISAKNIPATLYMMSIRNIIKDQIILKEKPMSIISSVEDLIIQKNIDCFNFDIFIGLYNTDSKTLEYSSCGNILAFIKKNNGEIINVKLDRSEQLGESGAYYTNMISLESKDKVLLFTEGTIYAKNKHQQFYGEQNLSNFLNNSSDINLNDLISSLRKDIEIFMENENQLDDITIMGVDIK